jgi:hypothetical protein
MISFALPPSPPPKTWILCMLYSLLSNILGFFQINDISLSLSLSLCKATFLVCQLSSFVMLIWKWNHHQFLQVTNMYEHQQSVHKTHVVKPSVGYLGNQTNLPININTKHYYEEFPITSRVYRNLGYGNIVEHRVVTMEMTLLLFNTWFWSVVERWRVGE